MSKKRTIEVIEEPNEQEQKNTQDEVDVIDELSNKARELELVVRWKEKCDAISRQLDEAKNERTFWQGRVSRFQKDFDSAYAKGWQGLANESPLLDQPGVDPDAWKNIRIADADMKDSLKEKIAEHFTTLGELAEWLNLEFPPKKKGIGPKVREQIVEWFDKFHAAATAEELARIAANNLSENETFCVGFDEDEDDA